MTDFHGHVPQRESAQKMASQLFIGRLPRDCRSRDLEDIFYKYGKMTRCDVKTGIKMSYGFIEYEDKRDAEDAIHNEHGRELDGSRIVVEWARGPKYDYRHDKERGGGGGGRGRGGGGGGGDYRRDRGRDYSDGRVRDRDDRDYYDSRRDRDRSDRDFERRDKDSRDERDYERRGRGRDDREYRQRSHSNERRSRSRSRSRSPQDRRR